MTFSEKLDAAIARSGGLLCIGLDSDYTRLPKEIKTGRTPEAAVLEFNREIIAATGDLAAAYKINTAFYEALGPAGLRALQQTVALIPDEILKIGDAKRGDIANTNRAYAQALFEVYGFDAVTVSPYLGLEALEPFFGYQNRGVFVLCRTSNPGASEFQDLLCSNSCSSDENSGNKNANKNSEGKPLYQHVAAAVVRLGERYENIGLVIGATWPEELGSVRRLVGPALPLLVPGVGSQAGDLERAVRHGLGRERGRLLINSARGIIFASERADFAAAARAAAKRLWEEINRYR